MQIQSIRVYQADLPLQTVYHISGGRTIPFLDCTMVAVETDTGHIGWGETCPFGPVYLQAFGGGARAALAELAPALIGQDPRDLGVVATRMDATLRGQGYVKAALDLACWDLLGQHCGMPLYRLLGGEQSPTPWQVPSIHCDSPEAMAAHIQRRREDGCRMFSAKASGDPVADIHRYRYLAERLQPGETLFADANGGWLPQQALRVYEGLRGIDCYIEQPCASYDECLSVRHRCSQPLMLDESMDGMAVMRRVIQDNAAEVINLKIAKVGGLSQARLIRDLCVAWGIAVTVQDTGGSAITQAAIAHLARATPEHLLLGAWDNCEFLAVPTASRGADARGGTLIASDVPGLGVAPLAELLGEPVAVYS